MKHTHAVCALLASTPFLLAPTPALADGLARHVCPNGLEVIVAEMHSVALVTVEIAVHNGSMTEAPDYNGLSHLYEHMFFKGNAALPDQIAYMTRARALGLAFNGTTDTERVNYYFTTASDHVADAMVFMRDAIVTPRFDEKELERERVVVTGEIDRNESDPGYYLWHTMVQHVYWKYPTRKDPLGARKTVLTSTTKKMRTIQGLYYVPNNSTLVVTGDVKADEIFAQADKLYEGWKKSDDPFKAHPVVKHPAIKKSEVVLIPQPVQNVTAYAQWLGPQTSDASVESTYAADLMATMANDASSKFQRALVDSGLCVSAGLSYNTQRFTGEIIASFEAVPEKAEACTAAVFAELGKLGAADYFGDDEMKNAARVLEVARMRKRESTEARAHDITYWWATATLDYAEGYAKRVAQVTRADIAKVVSGFITGKPFVLGAMTSKENLAKLDKKRLEKAAGVTGGGK